MTSTQDEKAFSTIFMNNVFSKWLPLMDGGMYVTIAGIDPSHAVRFETLGGYALAGSLGRSLVEWSSKNNTMGTMSPSTTLALKCLLKPLVSALMATVGSMIMPNAYSQRPIEVFKTGALIYLVADGISMKFQTYGADPTA